VVQEYLTLPEPFRFFDTTISDRKDRTVSRLSGLFLCHTDSSRVGGKTPAGKFSFQAAGIQGMGVVNQDRARIF
jgi:hypothetical protein